MQPQRYDMIFAGGGLAAQLLLRELGDTGLSVAIIDHHAGQPPRRVHWSYWADKPSFYDEFAIGEWHYARAGVNKPQPIRPYSMRLVRSDDVLRGLSEDLPPVSWIKDTVSSVTADANGTYLVSCANGTYTADWVFDSIPDIAPQFPSPAAGSPAWLSGNGLVVQAAQPVFDTETATLFDPLPGGGFAYVLPLSPTKALVESAHFLPAPDLADSEVLLAYLKRRYNIADPHISHQEYGLISLGFAAETTSGLQHILLGTKRGLVKPSTGYGIRAIEQDATLLAKRWRLGKSLPVCRRYKQPWQLIDKTFVQLIQDNPAKAQALMRKSLRLLSMADTIRLLDERLTAAKLSAFMVACLPQVAQAVDLKQTAKLVKVRPGSRLAKVAKRARRYLP